MKKCIISLALLAAFSSCEKQNQIVKENSTTDHSSHNNTRAKGVFEYSVTFTAGHPASQCHGQGACFNYTPGYWPNYVHIPCQGTGKDCEHTIKISIGFGQTNAIGKIPGYDGDMFLMPNRSLWIQAESLYLNIPQQTLLKVDGGYQFNNLSLTDQPVFENL